MIVYCPHLLARYCVQSLYYAVIAKLSVQN
jgi:hypothetical protein